MTPRWANDERPYTGSKFHAGSCIESDPDLVASVVLDLALAAYPAHLSIEELVREVVGGTGSFGERDDAMNAIRDLISDGLLHRNGEFAFATRAAVRAAELAY